MNFSGSGMVYAFMVIPCLFALVVVIQGIAKIAKNKPDGYAALGFGIFFFLLIITTYFLFIR